MYLYDSRATMHSSVISPATATRANHFDENDDEGNLCRMVTPTYW